MMQRGGWLMFAALLLGVWALGTSRSPAAGEASPEIVPSEPPPELSQEFRAQRAEELLQGVDLSPKQRKILMDRLVNPPRPDGPTNEKTRGRRGEGDDGISLTPKQVEEVERFLIDQKVFTEQTLRQERTSNPREYNQMVRRLWRGLEEARRVAMRHPETAQRMRETMALDVRTQRLGQEYRNASDEQRAKIGKELRSLLDRYFDLKTQMRRDEINRLREELNKLEAQIKEREAKRAQVIERQFSIVTGQGDPLEM